MSFGTSHTYSPTLPPPPHPAPALPASNTSFSGAAAQQSSAICPRSPTTPPPRRYPANYPRQPVSLRLQRSQGLTAPNVKLLAATLTEVAERCAADGAVSMFNIVEECQEFLRQRNTAPIDVAAKVGAGWGQWVEGMPCVCVCV